MAEKVLPIPNPDKIAQETGYWCGPASCQTALQVIDEWFEEQQLADEMHTTEDGTNSIELLAECLNSHAHHASWQAVWLPNDPPTREQGEQFWIDLKANIEAGFAMPANWVSPEGNHPVAVLPNSDEYVPDPGYYGTVFHYVCYVGYSENERGRFINVADSGFHPWQYWVTFEQAMTLMPPKGYVKAAAAPVGVPTLPGPAPVPEQTATCLTGRPYHHSNNEDTDGQVLDIRAEGLITQALVYAVAEKLGLDARGIYDGVRNSF